jgi:KDO2-lipid IV(A) lauroyltransferase
MAERAHPPAAQTPGAPPAPLPRVHTYDDRPLTFDHLVWPVETPPFEDPDARRLVHRVEYAAMRSALRLGAALPRSLQEGLVRAVAGLGRCVDRRHTRAAREFIATALPELDTRDRERLVRGAWRHLLRVALAAEGVPRHILGRRFGDVYDLYITPEIEELIAEPGGFVCVTAHVGYWEVSPPGIGAVVGRPCYAVGKAPRNDFVAQHVRRMREAQGMRLVPRKGAMQVVPAALRAGCAAGLLLDHRPRQKPVFAPYFGRLAACDRSAGVLLRRVDAPIVFYGCYGLAGRESDAPWRFELRFTRLVRPEELYGLEPEAIASLINHELEALVRHRPDQYFWLHDRYRGAPPTPHTAHAGHQDAGSREAHDSSTESQG